MTYGERMPIKPALGRYIEAQLLEDLRHYMPVRDGYEIDWEECNEEGNAGYLDEFDDDIEGLEGVQVRDESGNLMARGWFEWVRVTPDRLPIVFWYQLEMFKAGVPQRLTKDLELPQHIWRQLSDSYRDELRRLADEGFGLWRMDPKVRNWANG